MGRGFVEEVDDFRVTNPPTHPALLDALARDFIEHEFDLRHLMRTILNSRTYQLSAEPNDSNRHDTLNYSHFRIRRLLAETMLDAMCQVTGVEEKFAGYPPGTRAMQVYSGGGGYMLVELRTSEPRHHLRARQPARHGADDAYDLRDHDSEEGECGEVRPRV